VVRSTLLLMVALFGPTASSPLRAREPDSATAAAHLTVVEAERAKLIELMQAGPLVFRRAMFVTEVPVRFGEYVPRSDRPFDLDEPMVLYVEPVGVVWMPDGDTWRFEVALTLAVETEGGRAIARETNFGHISARNRERPTELMTYLSLNVHDAPPGRYAIVVTLHDSHSQKSATLRMPFSIADKFRLSPREIVVE
jgi:hypothetical protein